MTIIGPTYYQISLNPQPYGTPALKLEPSFRNSCSFIIPMIALIVK
jgi:hypothetical protein